MHSRHRSSTDSARGASLGRCAGRRRRVDCGGSTSVLAAAQTLSHPGGSEYSVAKRCRDAVRVVYPRGHAGCLGQRSGNQRRGGTVHRGKSSTTLGVRGNSWKSRRGTVVGCPKDPIRGTKAMRKAVRKHPTETDGRSDYEELFELGAALRSADAVGSFVALVSSSRRMGRSSGASTPIRTMPGAMRTTVMEILSPIRIFSPGFRDRTSIRFAESRSANSPEMLENAKMRPHHAMITITLLAAICKHLAGRAMEITISPASRPAVIPTLSSGSSRR